MAKYSFEFKKKVVNGISFWKKKPNISCEKV